MADRRTVRSLWRDAIKSKHGPEPTKRLLLLLLADYMSPEGEDCFPAIKTVAGQAGVAYSTARRHINEAVENGWLIRKKRKRGYIFHPSIPPNVGTVLGEQRRDTAGIWRHAVQIWRRIAPKSGGVNRLQEILQRDTTAGGRTNGGAPKTVTCQECKTDYLRHKKECPYCVREAERAGSR